MVKCVQYLLLLSCLFHAEVSGQRMWGSYEGSVGGTLYGAIVECGDTIIDGAYYTRYEKYTWNPHKGTLPFRNGEQFTRKVGNKVFRWTINGDILLYDYSLDIGDTVDYSVKRIENRFVITSVDSVDLFGKLKKRIKLRGIEHKQPDEWIEGFGSTYNNYFKPGELPIVGNGGSWSVCLMDGETGDYWQRQSDSLPCLLKEYEISCEMITSTSDHQAEAFKVVPNPIMSGVDRIRIEGVEDYREIVLIGVNGSRLIRTTIRKLNEEALSPGVYMIKIRDGSSHRTAKLLVR